MRWCDKYQQTSGQFSLWLNNATIKDVWRSGTEQVLNSEWFRNYVAVHCRIGNLSQVCHGKFSYPEDLMRNFFKLKART